MNFNRWMGLFAIGGTIVWMLLCFIFPWMILVFAGAVVTLFIAGIIVRRRKNV